MASALRAAVLGHVRVPVITNGSKLLTPLWIRSMSSHDDHLEKSQVTDRILDIVKSFPKVDPSMVFNYNLFNLTFIYFNLLFILLNVFLFPLEIDVSCFSIV